MSNHPHRLSSSQPSNIDHRKKLTDAEVVEIRRRYFTEAARQVALASEYGVSQTAISLIVRYRSRWSGPGPGERASFGVPPPRGSGDGRETPDGHHDGRSQ